MPKLWTDTVADHRRAVRDAVLDATAALVAEQGLASVAMTQVADRAGIGRATLYKYFPDLESVLAAWHERQVAGHLAQLTAARDRAGTALDRLAAVLHAYAWLSRGHDGSQLAAALHRGAHADAARRRLHDFVRELVAEAARDGRVRTDVPPDELADYVTAALSAAGAAEDAAVARLVAVTLDGLRAAR
ncbi:TetR/AcrR family transcriptional regulator [Blastococcus deserti]|uniref:TetR/AcrR family transcriptional regulator n=1 Tax=Blastococcus deserti TaxID=2259033 RepID=A0ABW4XB76_9ACTN